MEGRVEIRQSASGPTLHGVVIQEGRAARRRREVFAPGSVEWPDGGMGVLLAHRGVREVRAIPTRDADGVIRIEAPATPAIREAVAGGKRFMSVEFVSLEERTTAGGIREIVRALVPDVALVTDPEYGQTAAELRQRGAFITSIATDTEMDCRCSGTLAEDNVYEVSFSPGSFDDLLRDVRSGGRNVSAISRGAGDVVADTRTGSLRLRRTDDGGLGIGIDPLDTLAGRSTRELIEAGVAVLARPVLSDESGFEVEGNVARISEAVFSYILVKPTDREGGQQPLRPARASRRREQRGAPSVEPSKPPEATRRRLWL